MDKRHIKYQEKYRVEIDDFCKKLCINSYYPEHNDRYLAQCYYNLQEKYDRGIISEEEFKKIINVYEEVIKYI